MISMTRPTVLSLDKLYSTFPAYLWDGDVVNYWSGFSLGSVLPLNKIPEGTKIFGIETYPGSGPKICRSSGSFATVKGKIKDKDRITLRSGKTKELNEKCLATIGIPAGGGRKEKNFLSEKNQN